MSEHIRIKVNESKNRISEKLRIKEMNIENINQLKKIHTIIRKQKGK